MSVEEVVSRPLSPGQKAALATEILLLYVSVRLGLRRRTLPEVLAGLRAGPRRGELSEHHPAVVYRLARAVERVLGRLPRDSSCLVRSLVLLALLARRSRPATLVIGVRPGTRFAAHAWVECDGRAMLPAGGDEFARLAEM